MNEPTLKGGSWASKPRASEQMRVDSWYRSTRNGVRLVRVADPIEAFIEVFQEVTRCTQ